MASTLGHSTPVRRAENLRRLDRTLLFDRSKANRARSIKGFTVACGGAVMRVPIWVITKANPRLPLFASGVLNIAFVDAGYGKRPRGNCCLWRDQNVVPSCGYLLPVLVFDDGFANCRNCGGAAFNASAELHTAGQHCLRRANI